MSKSLKRWAYGERLALTQLPARPDQGYRSRHRERDRHRTIRSVRPISLGVRFPTHEDGDRGNQCAAASTSQIKLILEDSGYDPKRRLASRRWSSATRCSPWSSDGVAHRARAQDILFDAGVLQLFR